jgi:RNA cap guanine-N2 methyltransferase
MSSRGHHGHRRFGLSQHPKESDDPAPAGEAATAMEVDGDGDDGYGFEEREREGAMGSEFSAAGYGTPSSKHQSYQQQLLPLSESAGVYVPATPPPSQQQQQQQQHDDDELGSALSSNKRRNNGRSRPKTPPRTPTTHTPPAKRFEAGYRPDLDASAASSSLANHQLMISTPNHHHHPQPALTSERKQQPSAPPADMTVLICRVDLFDSGGVGGGSCSTGNAAGALPEGDDDDHQHRYHGGGEDGGTYQLASTPPQHAAALNSMHHHHHRHASSSSSTSQSAAHYCNASPPQTPPGQSFPSSATGAAAKPPKSPVPPHTHHHPGDMSRTRIGPFLYANPRAGFGGEGGMVGATTTSSDHHHHHHHVPQPFTSPVEDSSGSSGGQGTVAVVRVPHVPARQPPINGSYHDGDSNATSSSSSAAFWMQVAVFDKHSQPFPPQMDPKLSKYWHQRRRLFHKFDDGIQLDDEGWFSVSPEQVADHVSKTVGQLLRSHPVDGQQQQQIQPSNSSHPRPSWVMLDAFCGCGGNSISFAKCLGMGNDPCLSLVVAVDMDRAKLRKAAHNAAIYSIPKDKIVFVEANVLFLLEHAYRNGEFVLDQPLTSPEAAMALMAAMPPPVETENVAGYCIGGIDLLPRTISLVHLDPPWGGVEYQVLGKNGYDLQSNMKIQRPSVSNRLAAAAAAAPCDATTVDAGGQDDGELQNDFFDSFCSAPSQGSSNHGGKLSKQQRKAQFNAGMTDDECVNGEELLALAAAATQTHIVSYDVPRNINRNKLGQAALRAGYRGNCRLEEQYLNGRLKTVTAYFGSDWSSVLADLAMPPPGPAQPSL